MTFLMTGGGTGGHVVPAIAVARELVSRGHSAIFAGTREGMESKLVPAAGFPIEYFRASGFNRAGLKSKITTLVRLPAAIAASLGIIARHKPAAIFSMGGFVAAPPMIAGILRGVPVVAMEPNAVPGLVTRKLARWVRRALVAFEEAIPYFPSGRAERCGLPVRDEFFAAPSRPSGDVLNILVTGGSQGSKRLNEAMRDAWPLLAAAPFRVRIVHQTGRAMHAEIAAGFAASGLAGEVVPFIDSMAEAFGEADLIICRSGAGTVAELAASGRPAILVPFPFAADDHQLKNAESFARAGAARLLRDADCTGSRVFDEIASLAAAGGTLPSMAAAARRLARPGGAKRAAEVLVELGEAGKR